MITEQRKPTQARKQRKRGFALLITMLLIALLIAGLAELVTVTSTEAIITHRRHNALTHQLAVDSAILLIADQLTDDSSYTSPLIRELDQRGVTHTSFQIAEVHVDLTIRDDGAKLNPVFFQEPHQQSRLQRKLALLQTQCSLPHAGANLQPLLITDPSDSARQGYFWFDQILSDMEPGDVFRGDNQDSVSDTGLVWSDVLTFWGDGKIDLRSVDANVLEVMLEDIRPGLARRLLANRPLDRNVDFLRSALTQIDAEVRQQVADRVTFDSKRYALRITTATAADHRQWYMVAQLHDDNVTILHRSQLRW